MNSGQKDELPHRENFLCYCGFFKLPNFGNPAVMAIALRPVVLRHHLSVILPFRNLRNLEGLF
jgi:hypothetical protein